MSYLVATINNFQKKHSLTGFCVAVIKKYQRDETGRLASLLTYYLFTSLFPLLLVLTTLIERFPGSDPSTRNTIIKGVTDYFPVLGNQLSSGVHSLHGSDLFLVLGILFIIYGSRGAAIIFRVSIRRIWGVERKPDDGFISGILRSLSLIIFGGGGFILASTASALAASAGRGLDFRLLSLAINVAILFCLFTFIINTCLPRHIKLKEIGIGAAAATIGLLILQLVGSLVISRELKHLDALYSYFALALGLIFWLYLQAQVIFFAIEISVVSSKKLWPVDL